MCEINPVLVATTQGWDWSLNQRFIQILLLRRLRDEWRHVSTEDTWNESETVAGGDILAAVVVQGSCKPTTGQVGEAAWS